MAADRILIFDTTLRDGEQGPGFSLHVDEKLALARALDALGVDIMEAGFPIASPKDAEAVRRIATDIRRPTIAALARCRRLDLEKTFWALEPAAHPRVHIVLATSDLHLEKKLNMTRSQCIDAAAESVRFARAHVDDVEFSAEDALRSDVDFLCRVIEAVIQAGATTINLPDTVGYSTPNDIGHFFRTVRAKVNAPDHIVYSAHCHDDLGLDGARRAGEQGDRRPQCLRARSGHPSGRHSEGSAHLRDHGGRGRGRAVAAAGAREALGPARRAETSLGPRPQRGRRADGRGVSSAD